MILPCRKKLNSWIWSFRPVLSRKTSHYRKPFSSLHCAMQKPQALGGYKLWKCGPCD